MKIWEILRRETDEDHPMGTETLRERLKESGYPCTRKTLYGDIALLNDNGYEVMRTRKRFFGENCRTVYVGAKWFISISL